MLIFWASAAGIIAVFLALGALGAKNVGSTSEYSLAGKRASAFLVAGIFMGSLVGGPATIGSVQMAYEWGLSAFWLNFGGGLGCLLMGICLAKPLQRSGLSTIPEYLYYSYGHSVSILSLISITCGTFFSVVAQFLAGIALFRSLLPLSAHEAAALVGFLILGFIFFGGIRSYSAIGTAKTFLLYLVMLSCLVLVWRKGHSVPVLLRDLPFEPFLNPLAGGVSTNLSALISMIVGMVCTQIFVQGIFSASSVESARKGVLAASFVLPTMGFISVIIGLSLRHSGIVIEGSQALPYIIKDLFNPVIGGVFWAGILVAIVCTAAGLILGISTNIVSDLTVRIFPDLEEGTLLFLSRFTVFALICLSAIVSAKSSGSLILKWTYLGMGLRAAATFFPFIFAIVFPGRLPRTWGVASSAGGFFTLLAVSVFRIPLDPVLAAIGISGVLAFAGFTKTMYYTK
ncbi:MAG TPA: hypothetical protein PLK59_08995 [Synergistales bacterium]|nr:hypothetical protein [Synergistales bacterium]